MGRDKILLKLPLKLDISHKTKRVIVPYLYQVPAIFLLMLLLLVPIISVIFDSTLDNIIINKNPSFVGLDNYKTILTDEPFRISLINTTYFTVMNVIFHLIIGFSFALLLNHNKVNGIVKAVFRVIYIMPWVFTASIIAITWRMLLDPQGVINYALLALNLFKTKTEWFSSPELALHAVTFVSIWAGYPFYMVSLLAGLQGIPQDLYEAATIDGAKGFQRLRYITLPHLKPVVVSISMLDFIWTLQTFPLIWMTTGGGPLYASEVLSTYTYKLAFRMSKYSLASASAVIILILCMSMAVFYVRHQKGE